MREKIVAAARASSGASCVPERPRRRRLGLRRRAGRAAGRAPPVARARARPRAARTPGASSTSSTRTTASASALEELDLDRHGDVDAAIVAYPHGAAAPTVAALRARGVKVVDLSADFRLRDRATYEALVRPARGAASCSARPSTGCPSATATSSRGADLVAGPGCFPTAALLALAPLARAPGRRGRSTPRPASPGAGRAATDDHALRRRRRERHGLQGRRATATRRRSTRSSRAPARGTRGDVRAAPACRSTRASWSRCYVTLRRRRRDVDVAALFADAYAGEPFVELVDAPPGVRDVRETNLCRIFVHAEPGTGKVIVFAAIDNLWKGTARRPSRT